MLYKTTTEYTSFLSIHGTKIDYLLGLKQDSTHFRELKSYKIYSLTTAELNKNE